MTADPATTGSEELGRLRWRCRRGMRELDQLLIGYLETCYSAAPAAERRAFIGLLDLPDPELWRLCRGRASPADRAQAAVIDDFSRVAGSA